MVSPTVKAAALTLEAFFKTHRLSRLFETALHCWCNLFQLYGAHGNIPAAQLCLTDSSCECSQHRSQKPNIGSSA